MCGCILWLNIGEVMSKIKKPSEEVLDYIRNNYFYIEGGTVDSINKKNVGFRHDTPTRVIIKLEIRGRKYMRSHIIWFLYYGEWPKIEIDHEDRDSMNDDVFNLRQVTPDLQQQNKENYKGYRGFSVERTYEYNRTRHQRWKAHNQKRKIYVGRYYTREEAIVGIDEYWKGRGFLGSNWDFE